MSRTRSVCSCHEIVNSEDFSHLYDSHCSYVHTTHNDTVYLRRMWSVAVSAFCFSLLAQHVTCVFASLCAEDEDLDEEECEEDSIDGTPANQPVSPPRESRSCFCCCVSSVFIRVKLCISTSHPSSLHTLLHITLLALVLCLSRYSSLPTRSSRYHQQLTLPLSLSSHSAHQHPLP